MHKSGYKLDWHRISSVIWISANQKCGISHSCKEPVRALFLQAINPGVSSLPTTDASSLVASWLVLAWVLIVEVWHWLVRLKTRISLEFLEELRDQYSLRPLPAPVRGEPNESCAVRAPPPTRHAHLGSATPRIMNTRPR